MESHHFEFPISTLKVEFECSKHCPMDVKKMLQQLKGVKSISIDPSQGRVTVIGEANPMHLVKLLQKMGKKAQLWSFDRAPMQGKYNSHCCCESDSEEDDCCNHDSEEEEEEGEEEEEEAESIFWEHLKLNGQKSNKTKHGWIDWFGFGNKNGRPNKSFLSSSSLSPLSPSIIGHYPPMSWNQRVTNSGPSMNATRPAHCYNYYGRNPSVLATYRRLSSRLSSKYNPMVNYTIYADNYCFTVLVKRPEQLSPGSCNG